MRKTTMAALAAASLIALAGCRQATTGGNEGAGNVAAPAAPVSGDLISGTWKTDVTSIKIDAKPDEYLLKDGKFSCTTCTPPISVAADGAFHPVSRPYADHMAVKVDDDHNMTRTNQKGGKTTYQEKYSVSGDGNTLTISFNDMSGTKPVTGSFVETRAAPAPVGAHAVSGSWKQNKLSNVSDEGLTITFRLDGDTLHMSTPNGQSYDAKLDGTETPIKGDIGGTTASVKKLADNSYQETDKRGGKVTDVITLTVGADGTLNAKDENKQSGSVTTWTATKQ
ncbi:MAG: hypothetical protein ACJ8FS_01760 [Sphingomicrobium sp.]